MKLTKKQAVNAFVVLSLIAVIVQVILLFVGATNLLSSLLLTGVVVVCYFGHMKALKLPDDTNNS